LPDDDGLVPRRRKDHIWIFRRCGQCSDPAIVACKLVFHLFPRIDTLECSSQNKTVCHDIGCKEVEFKSK
jgi:hypothetical protein